MNITMATARGARGYQEDTYLNVQMSQETLQGTLLGVFDGHGGDEASKWMAQHFERCFHGQSGVEVSLRKAFKTCAVALRDYDAGTTASVVFIPTNSNKVYTAVIGDSPIIVKTPTGLWFGPDHNVRTNQAECDAAIQRGGFYSGGYIMKHGFGLQMGRALGDSALSPILSTEPEISSVTVAPDGFILIGTDGLFDPGHYDFKKAAEQVIARVGQDDAQALVDRAVSIPTRDNVTCILVKY